MRDILVAIGEEHIARVRRDIGSATLRNALTLIVEEGEKRAHLFIPHYWAVYYHDGRGSVHPVSARKLVFFDDPRQDPRLNGGKSPQRASQVRRLTRNQYEEGLAINAERRKAGQSPFMFVVDSVGPASPHPFFDKLAVGAAERVTPLVTKVFDRYIQRIVDTDPAVKAEKLTARFPLG